MPYFVIHGLSQLLLNQIHQLFLILPSTKLYSCHLMNIPCNAIPLWFCLYYCYFKVYLGFVLIRNSKTHRHGNDCYEGIRF